MPKALITGVMGFAGSHLVELLLAKDYQVAGLDYALDDAGNIEHIRERLELHACDLRDCTRLKEVVSQAKPDEVYHLAAIAHVPMSHRNVRLTFDVNLYGTLNLFEAVKEASSDVRLLYVGTASEYGMVEKSEIPTSEGVPLRPVDPYGVSKASADLLAHQYHKSYGLHIVRVRPFNHIGPRQSPDYVVASLAKQIAEIEKGLKEPTITIGNVEARRDLTDVRDVVLADWLALDQGKAGEAYNICSEKAFSIREILEKLLSMTGEKIEIRQDPDRYRAADVQVLLGDCTKFRMLTGWRVERSIDQSLRDTLEYWRAAAFGASARPSSTGGTFA